jgi:Tfp pilus assembly protein PilO
MNKNITALILIVLAIGIYFTFTQGVIDQARAIYAVNDEYTTAIANAKQLIAVRDQVRSDRNKISLTDQARLNRMLPSAVDNIHLIVDVSNLAQTLNVPLRNLKAELVDSNIKEAAPVGAGTSEENLITDLKLSTVRLTFEVTTSYGAFTNFMRSLETSLRIMDITRMNMKASDTGIYEFSVEINTYWLRQ